MDWEKLITLITNPTTGRILYRQRFWDYFCCWKWKWKNHATHATKFRTVRSISILPDISVYFFKKWIEKNSSLSSLTQELEGLFTDSDFEIIFVVENENGKSIPLTSLIPKLKELFQFYLIYWYIFHKMISGKLITLITCLTAKRITIPLQQHD